MKPTHLRRSFAAPLKSAMVGRYGEPGTADEGRRAMAQLAQDWRIIATASDLNTRLVLDRCADQLFLLARIMREAIANQRPGGESHDATD